MCRFVYYQGLPISLGALLTEPENSLINQSVHSKEGREPLNGDGFGVAWYQLDSEQPAVFKSITPAWSNQNLREIARVVRSPRILGHVRSASPGSNVAESNSHPFRHKNLSFMHNGLLQGFRTIRRTFLRSLSEESYQMISGNTDSEHMFAVMIDELNNIEKEIDGVLRLGLAIERGINTLLAWRRELVPEEHFYINCLLTDGKDAAACRFTTDDSQKASSLYLHTGKQYRCLDQQHGFVDCKEEHSSVLISSEILTDDVEWETVPEGQIVMIDEDQRIEMRPLNLE